ncbi:MAG: polysaccharide biosynthesis protein [Sphingomonas sp.]|nr:MAG: polysaccharide biosynthesis protein [Sphingomonas sp.]
MFGNLAKLLGGKAAAGLLSLVYLVIVAHQLGANDYGVLMLVNAYAVTVGSIVAFSGFHGVVRYGALILAREDRAGLARLIRFMTLLELGCGVAAVIVAAVGAPLIAPHLGWSDQVTKIAMIYSLAVAATVRATPQGVLQLADRFDLIALHQTVSPVTRMIGVLIVWMLGGGLAGYLIVWLASSVAEGVAMWILALPSWRRLVKGQTLFGPWRGVLDEHDGFFRFITVTNFDITLRELTPNLIPLTVGWLVGPHAAGMLALAQRATNLLQQPAVLLSQASYSVLAEQVANRFFPQLRSTVIRSTAIAMAAGIAIVVALTRFGDALVVALGGHSFAAAGMLLVLVGIGRACALASAPSAAALTALGRPGRSVAVALVTNVALYPLLPVLLSRLGTDGAGWHVLIQNLIAFFLLLAFFMRDVEKAA